MSKESFSDKKKRLQKILNFFKKKYPTAKCALNFKNELELLIATQLSAQCTDKRVNLVTKDLFKKYKTAKDYAKAPIGQLEKAVQSTGFFRNKARNLKKSCQELEKKYEGQVPKNFDQLVELAGVGRKTAHVVMGNGFQVPSGVVVDTHVRRLSNRLGLVNTPNVFHIETKLEELVPQKDWIQFSHWMIEHGRKICGARSPHCRLCFLLKICPRKGVSQKQQ
ncbi:MAG: endonuclease III [Bdellovibrionales bacterium]